MSNTDILIIKTLKQLVKQIDWITDIYIKGDDKVSIRTKWELIYEFDSDKWTSKIEISNVHLKDFIIENLSRYKETYADFERKKVFDFKFTIENVDFRVNASLSSWKLLLIFRVLNSKIIDLVELWIDKHFLKWILNQTQWLILISWPTGSWKSTTLSAIVNDYNKNYNKHIITLENPIEQVYKDDLSIIHQFELWDDFNSFDDWMENILRQDPDIIVIGEIRNKKTLDIALKLAETWHLVLWTIHWKGANWVIGKIIRMYENEKLITGMLWDVLIWVLYQRKFVLESWKNIVCIETLYNSTEVKAGFIQWKHNEFFSNMQSWHDEYMTTMQQYLDNYIQKKYQLTAKDHININNKIRWL